MSETKPNGSEPSDKILFEPQRGKVVGRNVAIALGIICIMLVAILGIVLFISYSPTLDSSVPSLQSQLTNLQSQLTNAQSQLTNLQTQYDEYVNNHHHNDTEYNTLQNEASDLASILNLEKSAVWASSETVSQPAGSYNFWPHSADYSGYVTVTVESSTTANTYIEVLWNSHGVSYYNKTSVGASGTGVFPILPSNVEVRVGNANLINGATETVTITYHY